MSSAEARLVAECGVVKPHRHQPEPLFARSTPLVFVFDRRARSTACDYVLVGVPLLVKHYEPLSVLRLFGSHRQQLLAGRDLTPQQAALHCLRSTTTHDGRPVFGCLPEHDVRALGRQWQVAPHEPFEVIHSC